MQIVLHVNAYYDWEPIPGDAQPTLADFNVKRIKAGNNGALAIDAATHAATFTGEWLMKVEKEASTETAISIPEDELQQMLVAEFTRGDKQPMNRAQLAHRYVTRHVIDHHTHPDWVEEVIVQDGGADEAGLRALLAVHVEASHQKIKARDVDKIVAKYMEPLKDDDLVSHFHEKYEIPAERTADSRARRADSATMQANHTAAHLAAVQSAARMTGNEPAAPPRASATTSAAATIADAQNATKGDA